MADHTAGPWTVHKQDEALVWAPRPNQEFPHPRDLICVASCSEHKLPNGLGHEESMANARLCAAAPRLYVALKGLVDTIRALDGVGTPADLKEPSFLQTWLATADDALKQADRKPDTQTAGSLATCAGGGTSSTTSGHQ